MRCTLHDAPRNARFAPNSGAKATLDGNGELHRMTFAARQSVIKMHLDRQSRLFSEKSQSIGRLGQNSQNQNTQFQYRFQDIPVSVSNLRVALD